MVNDVRIDQGTCTGCGLCGEVCPNRAMRKDAAGRMSLRQDRVELCVRCGQCMAICPSESILVEGLDYDSDFFDLAETPGRGHPFFELIATRRAVRSYEDRPVPRVLLEKVVEAIAFAPPSFPPIKTEIVVVQDPAVMRKSLPYMIAMYDRLVRAMDQPVARVFIRRQVGRETFHSLESHVVPAMRSRLPELKAGAEDTITRGAPAMILFHADRRAENYETDLHIALTYGFLAAHTVGLGATAIDLIPPTIERSQELRNMLSIPDGNRVVAAMILGFPRVRYRRGIRRELKGVQWI